MTAMTKESQVAGEAAYDVDAIRADFPILFREVYGKPLVYLDNGASAQKPRSVLEAIDYAYKMEYANVHRGLHYLSNAATARYEDARETVRRFLNAPSVEEIIFTRNATEAINLVASSYGAWTSSEGDEIVLSIMEHHSNIVPWHFHRERKGCVLKWAPIADDGTFLHRRVREAADQAHARSSPSPTCRTCWAPSSRSRRSSRVAHARGIPVLVDGSQAAVHMPVDVQDLDCDFYVFTGHKTYGPTGIGVLYAKKKHLDAMPPFMGGGEMIESVHQDSITYGKTPHKFEAGTPPIVQAIGLGAALDYMMQVGRERIARHEDELSATTLTSGCASSTGSRSMARAKDKGAIVSFGIDGLHPHDISTIIDRSGVAVRAGHHCAQPLMERLGVTATCRASFAMYNTRAEVDALAEALIKAHDFFG